MNFDIITAFPEAFFYLNSSLLKRAQEKKLISVKIWNLRDFTNDKRKTIDDRPFGGGPGMVLKIEPLYKAIKKIKKGKGIVILTDAGGKQFNQDLAKKFSKEKQIIIICGHYEGIDERIKKFVDIQVSIGPYILTGGELPAMTIIDAISRHIEGVLGNSESLEEYREQYGARIMPARSAECAKKDIGRSVAVFTRPEIFETKDGKKLKVPKVLLSGDHKKISEWRDKQSKNIEI